jgi:hypothetical protein
MDFSLHLLEEIGQKRTQPWEWPYTTTGMTFIERKGRIMVG